MYLLISYDIVDDRRRYRIVKFLLNYGHRVQKSVFEFYVTKNVAQEIIDGLEKLIDHKEDKVRFWYICKDCLSRIEVMGWSSLSFEEDEFWVV